MKVENFCIARQVSSPGAPGFLLCPASEVPAKQCVPARESLKELDMPLATAVKMPAAH